MKAINVERGLWRTVLKRNGPLLLPAARDALNARLIERAAFFHCEKATTLPSAERDSMIFQKASAVAFFIGFDSPERKSVHCYGSSVLALSPHSDERRIGKIQTSVPEHHATTF